MITYAQPPNLLRLLTRANFTTPKALQPKPNGLHRCPDVRCKLCRLYIQECTSFVTSKGTTWEIRSHVTCNSKNALYYLKCPWCNATKIETYTGRAVILRGRMNTHISCCKLGNGTDKFDKHVYECRQKHPNSTEPWFLIYVFCTIKDPKMLDIHEKHLHRLGLDTLNAPR